MVDFKRTLHQCKICEYQYPCAYITDRFRTLSMHKLMNEAPNLSCKSSKLQITQNTNFTSLLGFGENRDMKRILIPGRQILTRCHYSSASDTDVQGFLWYLCETCRAFNYVQCRTFHRYYYTLTAGVVWLGLAQNSLG